MFGDYWVEGVWEIKSSGVSDGSRLRSKTVIYDPRIQDWFIAARRQICSDTIHDGRSSSFQMASDAGLALDDV